MYKLNKEKTKMQSQADVSARPIFKDGNKLFTKYSLFESLS